MIDLGVKLGQVLAVGDANIGRSVERNDSGAIAFILRGDKNYEKN